MKDEGGPYDFAALCFDVPDSMNIKNKNSRVEVPFSSQNDAIISQSFAKKIWSDASSSWYFFSGLLNNLNLRII